MDLDIKTVKALLYALFKYEAVDEEDDILIELAIQDRVDYVLSYCNRNDIPGRLRSQLLRMICAEFLYQKYLLGGAAALGVETTAIVSGITVGDETVEFNNDNDSTPESILVDHLKNLRNGSRVTLQEYRRLKW